MWRLQLITVAFLFNSNFYLVGGQFSGLVNSINLDNTEEFIPDLADIINTSFSNFKSPVCAAKDAELYGNSEIGVVTEEMLTKYNQTICSTDQCKLTSTHIAGSVTFGYSRLNGVTRRQCEMNQNYRVCEVDSKIQIITSPDDISIGVEVEEKGKPVCVPPSCSDDQVAALDDLPHVCNEITVDCTIMSYDVRCPSRTTTNSRTCLEDKLPSTSPFHLFESVSKSTFITDCISMFSGTGSLGLCDASLGDTNAEFKTDFSEFILKDPSYEKYTNTCNNNGGMICLFDMKAMFPVPGEYIENAIQEKIPITSAGTFTIRNSFTKFPRCIATQCGMDDMVDVLVHHANKYLYNELGLPCDVSSGDCTVEITNIQCLSNETLSPSD